MCGGMDQDSQYMGDGVNQALWHKLIIRRAGGVSGGFENGAGGADDGFENGADGGSGNIYQAYDGESLLGLLRKNNVNFIAPCGGAARCGKCLVRVVTDISDSCPPTPAEIKLLTADMADAGYRLACFVKIFRDIEIIITPSSAANAKILTSGFRLTSQPDPYVKKYTVNLPPRTLEDQTPDAEHLIRCLARQYPELNIGSSGLSDKNAGADSTKNASAVSSINVGAVSSINAGADSTKNTCAVSSVFANIDILRKLPGLITSGKSSGVTCVLAGGKITGVESGDTRGRYCGAAVDIGTTTLAAYLFDLSDGAALAVESSLNPQAAFGADVISRITYASSSVEHANEMRGRVVGGLNALLSRLTLKSGVADEDIYAVYIAGNTTMLSLFSGLPTANIAVAPFIPVTTGMYYISADGSGLNINKSGFAACLPGVSAYVGADTLAAAVACDMDKQTGVSMLIDIGTNGEIAICGDGYMYACSTAAGPAFEGASVSCGVGGVDGAIDSVTIAPEGALDFTTISGARAIGICGSGLVDLAAQLLERGLIDETGRLLDDDEAGEAGAPPELCGRLVSLERGARAFMLAGADETASLNGIYVTQRDVRELQNAKAAIAAGIRTLLSHAGIGAGDVDRIYLAGGFGNYIRIESALAIGLIPGQFRGRVIPAGNAAGAGACAALLTQEAVRRIIGMSQKMRYIELSSSPAFTQAYIDCMVFE